MPVANPSTGTITLTVSGLCALFLDPDDKIAMFGVLDEPCHHTKFIVNGLDCSRMVGETVALYAYHTSGKRQIKTTGEQLRLGDNNALPDPDKTNQTNFTWVVDFVELLQKDPETIKVDYSLLKTRFYLNDGEFSTGKLFSNNVKNTKLEFRKGDTTVRKGAAAEHIKVTITLDEHDHAVLRFGSGVSMIFSAERNYEITIDNSCPENASILNEGKELPNDTECYSKLICLDTEDETVVGDVALPDLGADPLDPNALQDDGGGISFPMLCIPKKLGGIKKFPRPK